MILSKVSKFSLCFVVNNTQNTNEVVPDIVMDTAEPKETVVENPELEEPIPKESPPPYSEIDPMKKPKERPSSLDISVEETEPDVAEQSNTDLEVPEGNHFMYYYMVNVFAMDDPGSSMAKCHKVKQYLKNL